MASISSPDTFAQLRARLFQDELELPLLPDAATQVVNACFEEDVDIQRIAGMVERDPSLAANVLRVANSAVFGGREPFVTLSQAVARLGLRNLCDVTLSVALQGRVFSGGGRSELIQSLWHHASLTAVWAREIARFRRRNVESAFLIGLLHDVGKPVVIEQADRLAAQEDMQLRDEVLREWVDELHAEVGERLLRAWEMPDWAIQSARYHHCPENAESSNEEVATACLANLMAHWSIDADEEHGQVLCSHPVLEDLGIYADELQQLFERRDDVMEQARAFE